MLKVMKNYHFLVFLVYFSEFFAPFPEDFGQVKEYFLLEFHEMKRVPNVVACLIGFNLLCDRGQMGG